MEKEQFVNRAKSSEERISDYINGLGETFLVSDPCVHKKLSHFLCDDTSKSNLVDRSLSEKGVYFVSRNDELAKELVASLLSIGAIFQDPFSIASGLVDFFLKYRRNRVRISKNELALLYIISASDETISLKKLSHKVEATLISEEFDVKETLDFLIEKKLVSQSPLGYASTGYV